MQKRNTIMYTKYLNFQLSPFVILLWVFCHSFSKWHECNSALVLNSPFWSFSTCYFHQLCSLLLLSVFTRYHIVRSHFPVLQHLKLRFVFPFPYFCHHSKAPYIQGFAAQEPSQSVVIYVCLKAFWNSFLCFCVFDF